MLEAASCFPVRLVKVFLVILGFASLRLSEAAGRLRMRSVRSAVLDLYVGAVGMGSHLSVRLLFF